MTARKAGGGTTGGAPGGGGRRLARERPLKSRTRKPSSRQWLERQLNDPYVAEARRAGWRSRAAFKLIELDQRFRLLKPGQRVVDLGAAPGGWTQVAVERVRSLPKDGAKDGAKGGAGGKVLAVDIQEVAPIPGAELLIADLREAEAAAMIRQRLGGPVDVVLSDMSPSTTGHGATDHLRIVVLCEAAYALAREVLAEGGAFVAKVFQGGATSELLAVLKRDFATVRHAKPPASRTESAETYVVALGFRGRPGATMP